MAALQLWLIIADVQCGVVHGITKEESMKLREVKSRMRVTAQELEPEAMRRAVSYLSRHIKAK